MNITESIILLSSLISFVIGAYFLVKLSFKPNIWLGLLLIVIAYQMFFNALYWSNFNEHLLTHLITTHMLPMTLYGPLFYFYIRSLVKGEKLTLKDLVHTIWIVLYLIMFLGYLVLPYSKKLDFLAKEGMNLYINIIIPRYDWVLCVIMLTYLVLSFFSFKKTVSKEKDLLIWFKVVHMFFCVYILSFFAYYILAHAGIITTQMDYLMTYIMLAFVSASLYFCYKYPEIFNGKEISKVIPFIKYEKSGLSNVLSNELKEKLLDYMKIEKPYLDCGLRLNNLADGLNISRNHMSQIINEHFNMSFFEFINHYRLNKAIDLLESDDRLSITEIAFKSGFNNRVSFYNSFRKKNGITPNEYRKKLNKVS